MQGVAYRGLIGTSSASARDVVGSVCASGWECCGGAAEEEAEGGGAAVVLSWGKSALKFLYSSSLGFCEVRLLATVDILACVIVAVWPVLEFPRRAQRGPIGVAVEASKGTLCSARGFSAGRETKCTNVPVPEHGRQREKRTLKSSRRWRGRIP